MIAWIVLKQLNRLHEIYAYNFNTAFRLYSVIWYIVATRIKAVVMFVNVEYENVIDLIPPKQKYQH